MITTQKLVEKVAFLVNEPDNDSAITLLSEDTRSLFDTIGELLPDAVLFVQHNKQGGVLNPKECDAAACTVTDNGDGSVTVSLPDDFINLIEFRLDGWARPCTRLEPTTSPVALAQSNIYTRGGSCKPVCVESVDGQGGRAMNCYSLPAGKGPVIKSFVYEALFVPQTGLSCAEGSPLVWAVVYQCAALLYNVFEKRDAANAFMALAVSFCKNNKIE
ncbi:MAG: hypothetical protein IJZ22_07745 [Bacteroidaceae bacterium]|nr:hypothetical protein [Bacteroidaceae bacterium]